MTKNLRVIKRRGLKKLTLSKTSKGFVVSAPKYTPNYVINQFIKSHDNWIKRHKVKPKILNSWGVYKINYDVKKSDTHAVDGFKINFTHSSDCFDCEEFIEYRDKALKKIAKKRLISISKVYLDKYCQQIGVKINQVRYKDISSRWGSCSSKNNINLSIYLGKLPERFIDYVIAHEVCHLLHPNHSKKFWHTLYSLNNDFAKIKIELKKYRSSI